MQGALAFLGDGLNQLVQAEGTPENGWRKAAAAAAAAFRDFRSFLETELLAHPSQATACGAGSVRPVNETGPLH